jgi:predicted TIM-barrel fold metal-dependent hydrolase
VLPKDTKLISVDDHITEPPTVWTDRLPSKYKTVGPHVVELDDGRQAWAYEDLLIKIRRGNALPLPGIVDSPNGWNRFDEMRPGCFNPKERLVDMDTDGVWAELGFPDFARFSGHRFLEGKDQALALLCVSAYNDFVLDEWCAADPDRLFGLIILPYWNLDAALIECERIAGRGARAVAFSENPTLFGLPSVHTRHWDPLWAKIAEQDLPICMHIGSSSRVVLTSVDAPDAVGITVIGTNSMSACADWLFSGIFERFPSLQVVYSEGGAGWAPYIIERAEEAFEHYGTGSGASRSPRELFSEHVNVCMIQDNFALRSLGDIPVDNLLWETDYPHESGTFPNSRQILETAMAEVPDEDAVKIGETNARRLFKI